MNNHLFYALWFIVTFCLSSVLIHESVRKIEMSKLSSDMEKTKGKTFDNFYLGVTCFSLSFLLTTLLVQLYIQFRKIIKLRRSIDIEIEKYNRTPMTKDWLNEIKEPDQETV